MEVIGQTPQIGKRPRRETQGFQRGEVTTPIFGPFVFIVKRSGQALNNEFKDLQGQVCERNLDGHVVEDGKWGICGTEVSKVCPPRGVEQTQPFGRVLNRKSRAEGTDRT
jgi:hypothetical protein